MKEITFEAPSTIQPDLTEGVAVEILDRKLTRKATTTLSKPVKLEAGRYIAQATLSDGQVLSTSFNVTEDSEPVAQLLPDVDATSGSYENRAAAAGASPESVRAGVSAEPEVAQDAPEAQTRAIVAPAPEGVYCLLAGNYLKDTLHPIEEEWRPTTVSQPIDLTGAETPRTLQLQCGAGPVWNMLIPLNPGEPGKVIWHWQDGRVLLDVTFSNQDVITLLRHAIAGRITEAALCIDWDTPIAKKQLRGDPEHPICAVICGYILLRTNQIERLDSWLREFADRFDWLPDSLLVLAEYYARRGEHDEAYRALLKLSGRGLPLFSSGLSYAVDRLSIYEATIGKRPETQSRNMKEPVTWGVEAKALLEQLRGIAKRTDFDRNVLTYKVA